ncbi:MAG: hypothetical protein R3D63_02395 [Paracoccaceae bacterium]
MNLTFDGATSKFDILLQNEGDEVRIDGCSLPMPGQHNVSNALSAVAVARHLGMKKDEDPRGAGRFPPASIAVSPALPR